MIGLSDLKGGATVASMTGTRSTTEKLKKPPRKVSDAPDKKESAFRGRITVKKRKIDGEDKHG